MTHWSWQTWGWNYPWWDNQFESSWENYRSGGRSDGHSGGHWWGATAANGGELDDRRCGQGGWAWDNWRGDGDDLATLRPAVAGPAVESHKGSSPPSSGTDRSWKNTNLSKDGGKSGSSGSCHHDWDIVSPGSSVSGTSAAWWENHGGHAAVARPLLGTDRQAGQNLVACYEEETEPTHDSHATQRQIEEKFRRAREIAASEARGASSSGAGGAVQAQQEARSATQREAPVSTVVESQGTLPAAQQDADSAVALEDQRVAHQLPPPGLAGKVYDAEFFLGMKQFTDTWTQHNAALKYLRDELEDPNDPHGSQPLSLQEKNTVPVATIVPHTRKSGPEWEFDKNNMREWCWKGIHSAAAR